MSHQVLTRLFVVLVCIAAVDAGGGKKAKVEATATHAPGGFDIGVQHKAAPKATPKPAATKTKAGPNAADIEVHGFAQREQGIVKSMKVMDKGEHKIQKEVEQLGGDIQEIQKMAKSGVASTKKMMKLKASIDKDAKHDLWAQEGTVEDQARKVHSKAGKLVHSISDERDELGDPSDNDPDPKPNAVPTPTSDGGDENKPDPTPAPNGRAPVKKQSILSRKMHKASRPIDREDHIEHVKNPVEAEKQILNQAIGLKGAVETVAAQEEKAKTLTRKMAVNYNKLMADYSHHDLSTVQMNKLPTWAKNDVHELGEMGLEAAAIAKAEKKAENADKVANHEPRNTSDGGDENKPDPTPAPNGRAPVKKLGDPSDGDPDPKPNGLLEITE